MEARFGCARKGRPAPSSFPMPRVSATRSGRDKLAVMEENLRKTKESRYEVVVDGEAIGEVWNWHGSWSARAGGKTYHGLKSRKKAIQRVQELRAQR